jgi:single-strand DNA-binding protein
MSNATITVTGNMTRDPELKYTNSGKALAKFGIAVNKRQKVDGEWTDGEPSFFDVVAWDTLGENIAESLKKGTKVVIIGRIEIRTFKRNDGSEGKSIEITADEVAPSLQYATARVEKVDRQAKSQAPATAASDDLF